MSEVADKPKVHHGRNLKVVRETRGNKQDFVADALSISQSTVARLEKTEIIPDETLVQFAQLLNVDLDLLKEMQIDPERIEINIQNNTFEEGSQNNTLGSGEQTNTMNNHPLDEFLQSCKESDALVQELLDKEKEKISAL